VPGSREDAEVVGVPAADAPGAASTVADDSDDDDSDEAGADEDDSDEDGAEAGDVAADDSGVIDAAAPVDASSEQPARSPASTAARAALGMRIRLCMMKCPLS
jgi:hypothetical protein